MTVSRRSVLSGSVAGLAAAALPTTTWRAGADDGGVAITAAGQPRAIISYRADPSGQVAAAVATLIEYVHKASGATLPAGTEAEVPALQEQYPGSAVIEVGHAGVGAHQDVFDELAALSNDQGYVIAAHGGVITILGPSPHGTRFGVYEFLERHVGVRWLMASKLVDGEAIGEDVPKSASLTVPYGIGRDQPVFLGRAVSPFFHNIYQEWTRTKPNDVYGTYARAVEKIKAHHVLGSIFDPKKYAQSNPELYPVYDGRRYIPTSASLAGWQPRLTPDSAVDAAVAYSDDYFRRYPQFNGYSLSPNDDGAFSEDEFDPTVRNSIGALHVSEVYFSWVNKVAERMAQLRPDKTCGVYAYIETWDPPSFELHPNVVVFICQERYATVDPELRSRLRDHHRAWQQVARTVGTYDYLYGFGYSAPRMFLGQIQQNYREIADLGSEHIYAELHPGWGEGPKPWVTTKLLWDPARSADRLTREWCERAVGQRAAGLLCQYYRRWERIWEFEVPQTGWFDHAPRANFYQPFFPFQDPSYLEGVPLAELEPMRRLIEGVVAKAETSQQKARAASLALAADYFESTAVSYPRTTASPDTLEDAAALVQSETATLSQRLAAARHREATLDAFAADPILVNNARDPRSLMHNWSGWNYRPVWDLADFLRADPAATGELRARIEALSSDDPELAAWAQAVLALTDGNVVERGTNMSFDDTQDLAPWTPTQPAGRFESDQTREPIAPSADLSIDGGRSLKITGGARRVIPAQRINGVTSGFYRFSVKLQSLPEVAPEGYAFLQIRAFNAAGKAIFPHRSPQVLLSETVGRWYELAVTDHLPEETVAVEVQFAVQALAWGATTYVDDARFIQLS